jgi:hypothetical protein
MHALLEAVERHMRSTDPVVNPASLRDPDAMNPERSPGMRAVADAVGGALFFAYLARGMPERASMDEAERCLEAGFAAASDRVLPPFAFGGFTHVAWAAEHLRKMGFTTGERRVDPRATEADELVEVDAVLEALLKRAPWPGSYDLIMGLVGYGAYALERLPRPSGRALLERVIARLDETSESGARGVAWFTSAHVMPPWQRETFPEGYFNFGVAHGVPGVIAILAAAIEADVAADIARPLLEGAVRWLRSGRLPEGSEAMYPAYVNREGTVEPARRLAWCYGDAGIAVALLRAARRVGSDDLEEAARAIALGVLRRDPTTAGVVDGSLCHGACGLGHLFNRLWQATGDERHAEFARYWFREAARRFQDSGWEGLMQPRETELSRDLLTGSAGIGLAVVAALSTQPPEWDRMMLIDVPPRHATAEVPG